MIADLIDRVQKTQLDEKDPEAEQMLQQGFARTPNALYILAQTVLVQQYALAQAQSQLAQAQSQLEQANSQIEQLQQHPEPKHSTSFLGSLLGRTHDQQQSVPPPPPPQSYAPPQPPPYTPVPAPGYGYAPAPGGVYYDAPPPPRPGGGFLQNAMQTAAGVAAGTLAVQGIESLMHGFGHAAGYGNSPGFGGFGAGAGFGNDRPTENITNNYYNDDDRGSREDREEHGSHQVSSAERELGNQENYTGKDDSSDRSQFADIADDDSSLDDTTSDDTSDVFDNSGSDFDDSGSGLDDNFNGDDDTNFS